MNGASRPDGLHVRSVTGVDFTLPVAGPGGRGYAFIIDWHIRTLAAVAWLGIGALGVRYGLVQGQRATLFAVTLPALALYLLYHPVLELLMHGLTPGKRMAGVRVVMRDGSPPGAAPVLVRNVFRLVDALPAFYAVGLVAVFVTRMHVRLGDLAAGTILIYDEPLARDAFARLPLAGSGSRLTTAQLELVDDLIQRWPQLDPQRRAALAATLLRGVDADTAADPAVAAGETALLERLRALAQRSQG